MAVGTQVERRQMPFTETSKGTRKWIAAFAIAIAAIGSATGIYAAVTGNEAPASTPVVSSPEIPYVDPGVEARQDALKRFHQENASPTVASSDPQAALKRYHLDSKG